MAPPDVAELLRCIYRVLREWGPARRFGWFVSVIPWIDGLAVRLIGLDRVERPGDKT